MGGPLSAADAAKPQPNYARTLSALASPDDTFGLLRALLEVLESRLDIVRGHVEKPKRRSAP
jgi:hypothetical protein